MSLPTPTPTSVGELVASTEKTLRDGSRLDTWQGQAALALAHRIERAAVDTGASYASLHRELRAAMVEALRGVNAPKSTLQARRDELAARRQKRQGGA